MAQGMPSSYEAGSNDGRETTLGRAGQLWSVPDVRVRVSLCGADIVKHCDRAAAIGRVGGVPPHETEVVCGHRGVPLGSGCDRLGAVGFERIGSCGAATSRARNSAHEAKRDVMR